MSAQERLVELQGDRRQLLEYALELQPERDVRVLLPIGMERAEPWLLDALDASLLLRALRAPPPGGAPIELIHYCMQGARAGGSGGGGGAPAGGGAGGRGGAALSRRLTGGRRSRGPFDSLEENGEETPDEEPILSMPQMVTALGEGEIKDLAYLVVAATCRDAAAAELLATVRSQLDVDEERAAEVERLVRLVEAAIARTAADKGRAPLSDEWSASLELVMVLLETVLPKDFKRFKSFVAWRDTLQNALLQTLLQGVRDSWQPPAQADGAAGAAQPSAQQLLARLKGSLRRCDVRSADDFDEAEYREATRTLNRTTLDLVKCLGTGWRFPWGLRVRLCEMLLRGVFDTLEEGAYIAEADEYLQMLQSRVWPLLGVSACMHNSCFAWIHFRQFVLTRAPALVGSAKALLRRLAQLSGSRRAQQQQQVGGRAAGPGSGGPDIATEDLGLITEVGAGVIDWVGERLSDYHKRAKPLGGPKVLAGLVDVLAFAAQSRGDSPESVADTLIAAVHQSVDRELKRRVDAAGPYPFEAAELAEMFRAARAIADEELDVWASAFTNQLPEAAAIAAARIHSQLGARYLPFLGGMDLEQEGLEVVRLAIELEPALLAPAEQMAPGCKHPQAQRLLAGARGWGTLAQLQPVLAKWVAAQAAGFNVWVRRQMEQEDWKPLGPQQPHSQSARELRRMVLESLDALFGFGIPLPAEAVAMHLEALEGVFGGYLKLVRQRLGPWQRMVPAVPPLVRYKREVSVKQEESEQGLSGPPTRLPQAGAKKWLESVPRVEAELVFLEIDPLTPEMVAVMLCSLAYLEGTLQPMAASVSQRWQDAARVGASRRNTSDGDDGGGGGGGASGGGAAAGAGASGGGSNPFKGPSSGGGSNPFLAGGPSGGGAGGSGGGGGNLFLACGGGGPPGSSGAGRGGAQPGGGGGGGGGGASSTVAGSFTSSLLRAGAGGAGFAAGGGAGGASSSAAEVLGSLLEGASQALRHGMEFVARWLAVRVVWWDMRGEWCELLYRHRVCNSRVDFVEQRLGQVLAALAGGLPERERLLVASALLREVAAALERALLDGGPTRLFVPADAELLNADLVSLKQLFHADGDGVPWQEIDAALAGVGALLSLMETPTPALVQRHTAARRAVLLSANPSGRLASPSSSPRFGLGGVFSGGAPPSPPQAPLGAGLQQQSGGGYGGGGSGGGSRLSSVSNVSSYAGGGYGGYGSGGGYGPPTANSSSSQLMPPPPPRPPGGGDAASRARTPPPGHRRTSSAGSVGDSGLVPAGVMGQLVPGDMAGNDQVLLRVLCHRADHAASKYLKDVVRVPKLRDETLKEAVNRFTNKIL